MTYVDEQSRLLETFKYFEYSSQNKIVERSKIASKLFFATALAST